jgi:hypothetical protein
MGPITKVSLGIRERGSWSGSFYYLRGKRELLPSLCPLIEPSELGDRLLAPLREELKPVIEQRSPFGNLGFGCEVVAGFDALLERLPSLSSRYT